MKGKTPLQKFIEKNNATHLDLDSFGMIMDEFLRKSDCTLVIQSPKNSDDVKVQENLGIGPVGTLYFLLKSIAPVSRDIVSMTGLEWNAELLADALAGLVRADILEGFGGEEDASLS